MAGDAGKKLKILPRKNRKEDTVAKKKAKLKFETLKGRAQDIVMRLTNSIALHNEDCCTVENFAEEFKTTPGRLKTTLQQLEEAGLITIAGEVTELVVPTVKLLR